MTKQELNSVVNFYSDAFNKWANETSDNAKAKAETQEIKDAYAKAIDAPNTAPLVLMFSAFAGGFEMALEMLAKGEAGIEELKNIWGSKK